MFISYILAAFTLAAAMGKEAPILLSGHQTYSECLTAQGRAKLEAEKQGRTDLGIACLKIVWGDT